MRKKQLKQELSTARDERDAFRRSVNNIKRREAELQQKILKLEAEKKNRELADRIAIALGSERIYVNDITFRMEFGGHMVAELNLTGDANALYKFCEVLKEN